MEKIINFEWVGLRAVDSEIKTGTPVYVIKNGKIVDLTKERTTARKASSRRAAKK